MTNLTDPIFKDETLAREHFERIRWPDGIVCPHCGSVKDIHKLAGKSHRPGLYQCNACREHFSVTVGTVMERSHIPLTKWGLAFHLMNASKKGVSAHQLHRMLNISYKAAWFMAHRIREAMRPTDLAPIGGGGTVEVDETYYGKLEGHTKGKRQGHMNVVLTLVERGGAARSFHVDGVSIADLVPVIRKNIAAEAKLMTDTAGWYKGVGKEFASHETINHTIDEYVRGHIHTNTVEGYYSIFKRGMKGVYQHCKEKHLHRYLSEFDFRYSNRVALGYNDTDRTEKPSKAQRASGFTIINLTAPLENPTRKRGRPRRGPTRSYLMIRRAILREWARKPRGED